MKRVFFGFYPYWLIIFICLLHFFWIFQWPILNDESYYWDWSRDLQLSYIDAPPAIAWVGYIGAHLFSGNLSARFFVPFLYCFSTLFLIKSAEILAASNSVPNFEKKEKKRLDSLVILLFFCIPIFNIYGILLQPDAPLFFALTGVLYFALKSCEDYVKSKKNSLSLKCACGLGFFLGFGVLSKYQSAPLALGIFFAIIFMRGIQQTIKKDFLFWFITISVALCVASPVFIWNFQTNFASFRFQGQHGFSSWNINSLRFLIYIISIMGVMLPWYFYLCLKQVKISCTKSKFFKSLDVIPVFAFLSIVIFILSAALGKRCQVYWITPAFLFLIPLIAANWDLLTQKHPQFWRWINSISFGLVVILFSLVFTDFFQNFLGSNHTSFARITQKLQNDLFAGAIWSSLKEPATAIRAEVPNFHAVEQDYFLNFEQVQCAKQPYIASLHWRWTSQLAFFLENHPRVFELNLSRSTYYSWRDPLNFISGCRIFVIGEKRMFQKEKLISVMQIQSIKEFDIQKRYSDSKIRMVFVEGIMKNRDILKSISEKIIENAEY